MPPETLASASSVALRAERSRLLAPERERTETPETRERASAESMAPVRERVSEPEPWRDTVARAAEEERMLEAPASATRVIPEGTTLSRLRLSPPARERISMPVTLVKSAEASRAAERESASSVPSPAARAIWPREEAVKVEEEAPP